MIAARGDPRDTSRSTYPSSRRGLRGTPEAQPRVDSDVRGLGVLLAGFSGAMVAACTDFPVIARDTCGNGVVERKASEDCDLFAPLAGTHCATPGAPNQCRFVCGASDDGSSWNCPTGMACAADGVCRTASGTFT